MAQKNLAVTDTELTKLADDLNDMQEHLDRQVKRMDAVVDSVEAGWRGPAAMAYREFHRAAAEDAVRIREVMKLLEEAVRMSKDGFTELELDMLDRFRRIQVSTDIAGEVDKLSTPHLSAAAADPPARPRSSLDTL